MADAVTEISKNPEPAAFKLFADPVFGLPAPVVVAKFKLCIGEPLTTNFKDPLSAFPKAS